MATQIESLTCDNTAAPLARFSPKRLLSVVAAVVVALVLMYTETWVIEQAPLWSNACVFRPSISASSDNGSPLRDTPGPVAVLH